LRIRLTLRFSVALLTVLSIAPTHGQAAFDRSTASCAGAISWKSARSAVGKVATIKGPVVDSYYARTSNGGPTFLNLGRPYRDTRRFTVVIWERYRSRFGAPERRYRGRTICVRGRVSLYRGIPEIEPTSPTQIALG
jgi:hypothetical protein